MPIATDPERHFTVRAIAWIRAVRSGSASVAPQSGGLAMNEFGADDRYDD